MIFVIGLWTFLRACFSSRGGRLENLALRYQLLVLQRSWSTGLSDGTDPLGLAVRVWTGWRTTSSSFNRHVLAWHRRGFQLYWRWRSKAPAVGRSRLDPTFAISSSASLARTPPGAAGAFGPNSPARLRGRRADVAKYMHGPRFDLAHVAGLSRHSCRDLVAVDFFFVPTSPTACSAPSSSSGMTGVRSSTSTSRVLPTAVWTTSRSSRRSRRFGSKVAAS